MPTSLRSLLGGSGFIKPAAGQSASIENGIGSFEIVNINIGLNYSTIFSTTGRFAFLRGNFIGGNSSTIETEMTIDGRLLYSGARTGQALWRSTGFNDLNPPILVDSSLIIRARNPSGATVSTLQLCLVKLEF